MKKLNFSLPLAAMILLAGCGNKDDGSNQVISKRYIHKYGYPVSEPEWENNHFPGQVITTLRSGVTVTSTYENGVLNGPCTHTHPHSQTVQHYYLYEFGNLKKEVVYDSLGMPIREKLQLSPNRYSITMWYGDGTPMSMEDFTEDELIEGEYLTLSNEVESKVQRGNGLRTRRDQHGVLLSKDTISSGYMTKQEAFYPTGTLESLTYMKLNKRDGERRVFTEAGQLLAVEEWVDDKLHGKATYYANGNKQEEMYFVGGARHGIETHYIDGAHVEEEILWHHDRRHGPTKFYVGDVLAKTEWFYDGKMVSKKRYDELDLLDQMITQSASEIHESANR